MALWSPFRDSIDLSLRDLWNELEGNSQGTKRDFRGEMKMDLDINENDKSFVVQVDMPGVEKKDIKAHVEHDVLTVSAKRTQEKHEDSGTTHWAERCFGEVSRAVKLPKHVQHDQINAIHQNGVLTLTIPKVHESQNPKHSIKIE